MVLWRRRIRDLPQGSPVLPDRRQPNSTRNWNGETPLQPVGL